jgi:hypothetical protein
MIEQVTSNTVARLSRACLAATGVDLSKSKVSMVILRNPDRNPGLNDAIFLLTGTHPQDGWRIMPATCDPGPSTVANPANPKGAAILAPGYHRGLWKQGLHKGRLALVQAAECTVIRYTEGGQVYDLVGPRDTGWFGINFHSMGGADWSAGCVGPQKQTEVDFVRASMTLWGVDTISPVLLDASAWNLTHLFTTLGEGPVPSPRDDFN